MFKVKPTFAAFVDLPVPGESPNKVEFEFKHTRRSDLEALIERFSSAEEGAQQAVLLDVVTGWKYPGVEFSKENLSELFEEFVGSTIAIWMAFRDSLIKGGRKN